MIDIEIHSLAFFPLCFFPFGYIFLFALRRNNKNVLPTLHTSATSHQVLHNIWEGFWSRNLLREQRVQKKQKKTKKSKFDESCDYSRMFKSSNAHVDVSSG